MFSLPGAIVRKAMLRHFVKSDAGDDERTLYNQSRVLRYPFVKIPRTTHANRSRAASDEDAPGWQAALLQNSFVIAACTVLRSRTGLRRSYRDRRKDHPFLHTPNQGCGWYDRHR